MNSFPHRQHLPPRHTCVCVTGHAGRVRARLAPLHSTPPPTSTPPHLERAQLHEGALVGGVVGHVLEAAVKEDERLIEGATPARARLGHHDHLSLPSGRDPRIVTFFHARSTAPSRPPKCRAYRIIIITASVVRRESAHRQEGNAL
eukprot:362942-Chlamydomonas_euryale.AAC.1